MATTQEKSNIYTNQSASPPVRHPRSGLTYFQDYYHKQSAAGDAGSEVALWMVESGCRIIPALSVLHFTAFGSARVMQLGYKAYTEPDGTAVVADLDAFFSALDVSAAGQVRWSAGTAGSGLDANRTRLFRAQAILVATVTGGTWPLNAEIWGEIAYKPVG